MKVSKLVGERLKNSPSDVVTKGHAYLIRAGFVKQMSNGIYSLMPPAKQVVMKIENIIREEMNVIDGQEVLFPVVMPRELWDETGRFSSISEEMIRFKDRFGRDLLLGMTHEEAAVHMMRNTVSSYNQLPSMIYQIQTKFRDEARPRGGLIRVREFTMKDAYSFHINEEDFLNYYKKAYVSYEKIFERIGLKDVIAVESDNGVMGGTFSHEFMYLTDIGEDTIVLCDNCDYKANMEVATCILDKEICGEAELKEVFTGENKTIDEICAQFKISPNRTCKAVSYAIKGDEEHSVLVFVRGDLEVNESKLKNKLKKKIVPNNLNDNKELVAGNIGPKDLNLKNTTIIFDKSLENECDLIIGANKQEYHYSGFSFNRDLRVEKFEDVSKAKEGCICAKCGKGKIKLSRGVEVGNIFSLSTSYTEKMKMQVNDQNGKLIYPIMGCYGIGVGRALASLAEGLCDDKGLVWPKAVTPYMVYICPLKYEDEQVLNAATKLENDLKESNITYLIDDRNVSAGIKFNDSELIGIPVRVVISQRSLLDGSAEISIRESGERVMIKLENLVEYIKKFYA